MSNHDDSHGERLSLAQELLTKATEAAAERPAVNLLAKAVAILSRREHSELELRQKLQRYSDDFDAIDAVIKRLQRENWQSDERFVESFVQTREQRWGNQKILHALSQHKLDKEHLVELQEELKESEYERARDLWLRRYGAKYGLDPYGDPIDSDWNERETEEIDSLTPEEQAKEKARQLRFLASRGFSADVVYRVVNSRGAPEDEA